MVGFRGLGFSHNAVGNTDALGYGEEVRKGLAVVSAEGTVAENPA